MNTNRGLTPPPVPHHNNHEMFSNKGKVTPPPVPNHNLSQVNSNILVSADEEIILNVLKILGKGTNHEYKNDNTITPLPNRSRSQNLMQDHSKQTVNNEWFDISNVKYLYQNKKLIIKDCFSKSLVDYIAKIPASLGITVIIQTSTLSNEYQDIKERIIVLNQFMKEISRKKLRQK